MAVISCPSSKPCFTTSVPVAPVAPKTRSLSCLKFFHLSPPLRLPPFVIQMQQPLPLADLRMLMTKHRC